MNYILGWDPGDDGRTGAICPEPFRFVHSISPNRVLWGRSEPRNYASSSRQWNDGEMEYGVNPRPGPLGPDSLLYETFQMVVYLADERHECMNDPGQGL
jgi:hypothetical protein